MKRAFLAALAFAATSCGARDDQTQPASLVRPALPMTDAAGNSMEALTQAEGGSRWCSEDGAWCVEAGAEPRIINGERSIALPAESAELAVWPVIVRLAEDGEDAALVGLASTEHQMYSGGSADATQVALYAAPREGGEARHVLTLPVSGSASIRACFDAEDEEARKAACTDEYMFDTRVTLDSTNADGAPRIVLETAASTYPGRRSRQEDSTESPPLDDDDLVWAHDETCSYRRVFTRGPDGAYAPDEPMPPCADYLEP